MRPLILAAFVVVLVAPAALAAPACVDKNGDPIRCGARGAMPVGWSPPAAQLREKESVDPGWTNLVRAFCVIGLLLAGIALLPEFDGADDTTWDRQEGSDENGRNSRDRKG